ncbi:transglutaminase domain protein [Gloeothece citriformis PCC 7424]|uniref:Transglutaminase domain protein n=1 Tax=Gloeothece citriformis (strain PCC 7424) TaxID=65393 RepID=B7KD04_GLOC7|nr:transglutaminase family protein [Gloeothece citriformis]ACK73125.1 transglutaminase domain protein [Gloeothece citriformis PCC 7424]
MRYYIHHQTIYTYNQPVILKPHVLRLRPRCNGGQKLDSFSLKINPKPKEIANLIELEGNTCIQVWFTQSTETLTIETESEVETLEENPFTYLLDHYALNLPFDYPSSLLTFLTPYLASYFPQVDPITLQLAQEICHEVNGKTLTFLSTLNERIYQNCQQIIRETGKPWPAGITWTQKQGTCRDLVVLFMEVCRAVGIGSRFVSGYQEGDPDQQERDLHAWVEVYLPGGGWRGYDPTHGLAVSDRHIALVASAKPSYCSPVVGATVPVTPVVESGKPLESHMDANITIKLL